jgi:hypothetical protein
MIAGNPFVIPIFLLLFYIFFVLQNKDREFV